MLKRLVAAASLRSMSEMHRRGLSLDSTPASASTGKLPVLRRAWEETSSTEQQAQRRTLGMTTTETRNPFCCCSQPGEREQAPSRQQKIAATEPLDPKIKLGRPGLNIFNLHMDIFLSVPLALYCACSKHQALS